ncbi:MAG: hypothetical protein IJ778_04845 [Alphaproteobacteria bacterium]|nr:hypothetical protein [Alphaproteobacteria bacterium]
MVYKVPDHYSYKFKFDIDKLPAVQKDKISYGLTIWGLIFGLLFVFIGGYEIFAYFFIGGGEEQYDFNLPAQMSSADIAFRRYSFDTFLVVFGLLIIGLAVAGMLRYKKVFFDGDKITITHKPLFGPVMKETEDLYNYLGVLLKVEYYQLGMINRNRYIIELYHKEKNKRVPLYISTSGNNIREIWESYAAKLKMPALFMTDHGLVSRHHHELDKTLKDMSKRWHLNALYREEEHIPTSVKYYPKPDKVILKERRLFFDIYTVLAFLGVLILGTLAVYAACNYRVILSYISLTWFVSVFAACMLVIFVSLIIIFSKDVLIINKEEVILGHNISFLRLDAEFMKKNEIEAVDIGHNPITDRYYLSLISHDKHMVFGKNMPIDDLRWIRGLVIREIVK